MTWIVEVMYPAPVSEALDERIEKLAVEHGGCWSASGVALAGSNPQRDIEFHFPDIGAAGQFADDAQAVPTVTVCPITLDDD